MRTDYPRFSRRAEPPASRSIWRQWVSDYGGGIILAAIMFAAIVSGYTYHQFEMMDLGSAPNQSGEAIVISKLLDGGDEYRGMHWVLTLKFKGQTLTYEQGPLNLLDAIEPGDKVSVIYRTGASGHIYLSRASQVEAVVKRQAPANPTSR